MDIDSNTRKFSSSFRRKLVLKISKLKDKKDFVNIFNIIQNELGKEISINRNGIFFNMNLLSDESIDSLDRYLTDLVDNTTITETEVKIKYKPYSVNEIDNVNKLGPKLSNQEKSIIKKIHKI
jgi:hypothetical protein